MLMPVKLTRLLLLFVHAIIVPSLLFAVFFIGGSILRGVISGEQLFLQILECVMYKERVGSLGDGERLKEDEGGSSEDGLAQIWGGALLSLPPLTNSCEVSHGPPFWFYSGGVLKRIIFSLCYSLTLSFRCFFFSSSPPPPSSSSVFYSSTAKTLEQTQTHHF